MRKWVPLIVCLVGLLLGHQLEASESELKNLRYDWEVYDQQAAHFEPYLKQSDINAIRFELDVNKYREAHLKLALPADYYVWIGQELVNANLAPDTLYWPLDSIAEVYDESKLYVTIYSAQFAGQAIETSIINKKSESVDLGSALVLDKRDDQDQLNIFIIVSIATFALMAIFRAFNFRLFKEYFALGKSVQIRQNFDLITAYSPLSGPQLAFILFYAILVGNAVVNASLFLSDTTVSMGLSNIASLDIWFGMKVVAVCAILMIGKLLMIVVGTELFKINKVRAIHFFTYFRLSLIMAMIIFSLSVINGIFGGILVEKYWMIFQLIIVLAWLGRMVLVFFVLNKIYTFRKLHLFSYLCSSELIPLLLFFKIFLK